MLFFILDQFIAKQKQQSMQERKSTLNEEHTWSEMIGSVQSANLQQIKLIKKQQKLRKIAYKNQLDKQVQEQNRINDFHKNEKSRERTEIDEQVSIQKAMKTIAKMKKLKTQQKYRYQNLQLAHIDKKTTSNFLKYPQHPFVSLVQQQDARKKQTRNNFKLQNKLNQIQTQIHQNKQKQIKDYQKKMRKQYQNFVLDQFSKKQKEREIFKNKYLTIKQWQSTTFEPIENENPSKNYIKFLNNQVQEQKYKKRNQKQKMEKKYSDINRHIQIPDSSPAFLGRNPYSNDTKRQLEIIDSQLNTRKSNKIRGGSQLYSSVDIKTSNEMKQTSFLGSQSKRAQSNMKFLPSIQKSQQVIQSMQLPKTVQPSRKVISTQQSAYNPEISNTTGNKTRKSYSRYDFISGTNNTIII